MICVTVSDETITVTGHAGYAEYGHDIVCAGMSMLTAVLSETMSRYCQRESRDDGNEYVINIKDLPEEGEYFLRSFLIGAEMLAEDFSDFVTLRYV